MRQCGVERGQSWYQADGSGSTPLSRAVCGEWATRHRYGCHRSPQVPFPRGTWLRVLAGRGPFCGFHAHQPTHQSWPPSQNRVNINGRPSIPPVTRVAQAQCMFIAGPHPKSTTCNFHPPLVLAGANTHCRAPPLLCRGGRRCSVCCASCLSTVVHPIAGPLHTFLLALS